MGTAEFSTATELVCSKYLVRVPAKTGTTVLFNAVLADPLLVDAAGLRFVDAFKERLSIDDVLMRTPDIGRFVAELLDRGVLSTADHDQHSDYVDRIKQRIIGTPATPRSMTLIVSAGCNFACTYCYQRYAAPAGVSGGQLGGVSLIPGGAAA